MRKCWNRVLSIVLSAALGLGGMELPVRAAAVTEDTVEASEYVAEVSENVVEISQETDAEPAEIEAVTASQKYNIVYDTTYAVRELVNLENVAGDTKITLPTSTDYAERDGYRLSGIELEMKKGYGTGWAWYPSGATFTGADINYLQEGMTITVSPRYQPISYSISYVLEPVNEKGEVLFADTEAAVNSELNPTEYTIENNLDLYAPTKEGFSFVGWYLDASYEIAIDAIAPGNYGEKTLYAKWQENTYTIRYDGNGGTPEKASQEAKYTEKIILPGATASQEGYRIRYWQIQGTDTCYGVGEMVSCLSSIQGGEITLVANYYNDFNYIEYVLEPLDKVGNPVEDIYSPAKNHSENIYTYTQGESFTFRNPTKKGYTFLGWYLEPSYTTKIDKILATDQKDYKLYAKWQENSYTVKLHANDSAKTVDTITLLYTDAYELPGQEHYSYAGHRFVCWNTTGDFNTGTNYDAKHVLQRETAEGGVELHFYAMWLEETSSALTTANQRILSNESSDYNVRWAHPITVNLYENGDGTFTRVENYGKQIVAEKYSATGSFISGVKIPMELSKWGGFYAGSKYNYFVFGQDNKSESLTLETVRVVRYTKDWKRVDSCSISGINVYEPFNFGTLRMLEYGDNLYIHTCRTMFAASDGLHHQANMTLVIRVSDKEITFLNPEDYSPGYNSHSFNQYLAKDDKYVYTADHGDAYIRGLKIVRYKDGDIENSMSLSVYDIPGKTGDNATGVCLGGIQSSEAGCLVAANSVDFTKSSYNYTDPRNVFVAFVDHQKFSSSGVTLKWLTNYSSFVSMSAPSIVKLNENKFMVLWSESGNKVKYVYLDGKGDKIGEIGTMEKAQLSDMDPIVSGDKVIWYETTDSKPVFHSIGSYLVRFDSCGGSEVTDTLKMTTGSKYSDAVAAFPVPTRVGATFDGWYTEKEGGKKVSVEDTFSGISDTTLYAHWNKTDYKVSFVTGCDVTVADITVHHGDPYGELPQVERYGYELTGWYTAAEGGKLVDAETIYEVNGDSVLYARYKEVKYIFYDANGGAIVDANHVSLGESIRVSYDLDQVPTAITNVAKAGYTFLGWYTQKTDGEVYAFDHVLEDHITLYAQYEPARQVEAVQADLSQEEEWEAGTLVHLTCNTLGATIYYYVDTENLTGIDADLVLANGSIYEGALCITENMKLYALAVKPDYKNSSLEIFTYRVIDETSYWGEVAEEDRGQFVSPAEVPTEIWMAKIPDQNYNGTALTPEVHVYYGKKRLTLGTDYTVKFKQNVKAGIASVTATGKGSYKGSLKGEFQILPLPIGAANFASTIYCIENKKSQKPTNTLTYTLNGKNVTLKKGTDYDLIYNPNLGYDVEGSYPVIIWGKGNYANSQTTFTAVILKQDKKLMSKVTVAKIAPKPYNGQPIAIKPQDLKLTCGKDVLEYEKDYTIAEVGSNQEIGTAYVVLEGAGDYVGSKMVTFQITGTPIGKAQITFFEKSFVYTGKALTQDNAKLALKDGTPLNYKEDYITHYDKNVNVGTATVTYIGIGKYTGTMKKTYKITPYDWKNDLPESDESRIEVVLQNNDTYQKGGATPKPTVVYTYGEIKYTLTEGKDYTLKYKNNNAVTVGKEIAEAKKPSLTLTGKGNFKGVYGTLQPISFVIEPSDLATFTGESGAGSVTIKDVVYKDKADICKPAITLLDANGKKLVAGTDYDKKIVYIYQDDVVVEQLIGGEKIQKIKPAKSPVENIDIIPADTTILAQITALDNGKCNYIGKVTVPFRIVQADISKCKITIPASTHRLGGVWFKKSDLTVMNGKIPVQSGDYEIISYTANDKAGTATITIKGVGNYGGIKTQTFKIAPKLF